MNLNKVDTDNTVPEPGDVFEYIDNKVNKNILYLNKMKDNLELLSENIKHQKDQLGFDVRDNIANHLQIIADLNSKLISLTNSFFSNITSIQLFCGIEDNTYEFRDEEFVKNTIIQKNGNIIHIRYPILLPKKIKSGTGSGAVNQRIKSTYTAAIKNYFNNNDNKSEYREKVVLCIIHHYPSEICVKDHDNYTLREIINCLSAYLFIDDNAKWLAHYQDYVVDGEEYSEIFIIPNNSFGDFINGRLHKE